MRRRAIVLGLERTLDQDVAYGLRLLVDIAERSLSDSPFLDPTTAVQAIDRAGSVACHINVVIVLKQPSQAIARMFLIVDDQDSRLNIHGNGESQMLDARFLLSIKFAPITKHQPSPKHVETGA